MANKIQIKRTAVSSRTPNTTNSSNNRYIDTGELALNITDGKLFSSNGSVYFEVGANLQYLTVTSDMSVSGNSTLSRVVANGSLGTAGQMLTTNGTAVYWETGVDSATALAYAIALG